MLEYAFKTGLPYDLAELRQEAYEGMLTARRYGVLGLTYEAGTHAQCGFCTQRVFAECLQNLRAMIDDPRYRDVYLSQIAAAREVGVGLWNHFIDVYGPSRFGYFGIFPVVEGQREPSLRSPGADALMIYRHGTATPDAGPATEPPDAGR